jgi:hypothetical protein
MVLKHKSISIVFAVVLVFVFLIFGGMHILKNKRTHIPVDLTEEFFDELVADFVSGEPYLEIKVLFGSEDIAKQYARIIFLENYGEWDQELELWVKHYKKYGVWFAKLRANGPYLDGPPIIIFKDTDGQVIWYGR